jgi:hypothetical protein
MESTELGRLDQTVKQPPAKAAQLVAPIAPCSTDTDDRFGRFS